jgi:alpha-L-rhamnosidase
LTTEVGIYNYDTARLHTKWLRDFADAQLEDGEVPTIVPTSGWSYEGAEGWGGVQGPTPGWDVAYFLIPWWLYQYYGDERILETHYEGMKLYLDWLEGYADGYIVRVGLGDWSNPPEGPAITSTAYYYRMAQITAEAARRVDAYDDAAEYMELATNIYAAFNDEFLDAGDGVYRTGQADEYRQTSNVFPLAFDMVPEEYEEAVVANVVEDVVETNDGHLDTRTLGTKYLLPVLSEHGHHDVAYTVATQTHPPSWGHWIENGRTSLLEFWSLGSRSWNHHFLGTIDEWFYKHLAGIQVAEPGFAHVRIAPKPVGDLDLVSSRVDTIRGLVVSEWERTGDDLEFAVSIPGNATATVEIPTLGGDAVDVHEGGEPIWESGAGSDTTVAGIESVLREGDRIVVEVGAGEYEFELQQAG